jgi:hypothetical protein
LWDDFKDSVSIVSPETSKYRLVFVFDDELEDIIIEP